MSIPRDGEIDYKKPRELAFYYMFVAACLSVNKKDKLSQKWERQGDVKTTPWWQFIMEHVTIDVDI